ncbi:MAG: cupredoxin domain-containing protein [Thermoleophilia bacterium]|nr:cupredoxin domain-containing protein [Thermoleophilia bacterium]
MRHTSLIRSVLGIAAISLVAAGCGSASSSSSTSSSKSSGTKGDTITVTAGDLFFQPKSYEATAGKVKVVLKNTGKMEHEVIVLKTDTAFDKLVPGADGRVSEDASVGEVSETKPGATKSTTLTLKPGAYVLVCNIPGHYAGGMRSPLIVS